MDTDTTRLLELARKKNGDSFNEPYCMELAQAIANLNWRNTENIIDIVALAEALCYVNKNSNLEESYNRYGSLGEEEIKILHTQEYNQWCVDGHHLPIPISVNEKYRQAEVWAFVILLRAEG